MKSAKELHEEAMSFYEQSLAAKLKGQVEVRLELLKQAFKLEREAALLLVDKYELEPTRSKLFASCATIAYQLSDFRESEKMVAMGLAGNPPQNVLEELRDMFDQANFYRHLTTKGIVLLDDEFRFTLGSGDEIMKGMARGDEVITRIEAIGVLYSRTVRRMNNKPFQVSGRVSPDEGKIVQLYYKVPEAASFAITFKIPQLKQLELYPEHQNIIPYVDEMLQCIDLVNAGKMEDLRKKIPDESYFQSFIINARKIAPDGTNIKQVGFTVYRNNEEIIHPFSKIQSDILLAPVLQALQEEIDTKEKKRERIVVSGTILASDSTKKFITVVEEIVRYKKNGSLGQPKHIKHRIKFVTEAQKELVKDKYEEDVIVEVWKYDDNSLEFIDLKKTT